jgi:hypothetical protein
VFRRLNQEDPEFKVSLGYIQRSCLKTKQKTKRNPLKGAKIKQTGGKYCNESNQQRICNDII